MLEFEFYFSIKVDLLNNNNNNNDDDKKQLYLNLLKKPIYKIFTHFTIVD